jgi:phosphoribosylformylglycinamidine synthase
MTESFPFFFLSILGEQLIRLNTEHGFYIDCGDHELTEEEKAKIQWLLSETFEPNWFRFSQSFLTATSASQVLLEFGPRLTFTTPYSTNAVTICHNVGITSVNRIERTRRFLLELSAAPSPAQLSQLDTALHGNLARFLFFHSTCLLMRRHVYVYIV